MAEPEKPEAAEPAPEAPKTEVSPPVTRRGNIRMIIAIGLAMLVLAGGGVAIAIVASQPRPEDIALQQEKTKAREVAQKFALLLEQARNDGAFALSKTEVQGVLCAPEQDALEQEWQDRENKELMRSYTPSPAARLAITVKDVKIDGDHGVVTMTGAQADSRRDQDYALVKEESNWKVCGVTFRPPTRSSTTSPTSTTESVPSQGVDPSDIFGPSTPANPGNTVSTTQSEPHL
ncbi:hypothetical protein JOF56_006041 [Kibdelosporangium banguiense]|uniref:DUF4878 domain-containing protein n=1 Tax=Kibdelosporangium banguiense TaxID=1365924 RepID=A0ABS4TMM2_9PSEU|nr:hypothetical protein [Kibdelosporangium banguiense]MBP2325656.1 hypothetical protein [Kibdelosporangium banguiense]